MSQIISNTSRPSQEPFPGTLTEARGARFATTFQNKCPCSGRRADSRPQPFPGPAAGGALALPSPECSAVVLASGGQTPPSKNHRAHRGSSVAPPSEREQPTPLLSLSPGGGSALGKGSLRHRRGGWQGSPPRARGTGPGLGAEERSEQRCPCSGPWGRRAVVLLVFFPSYVCRS